MINLMVTLIGVHFFSCPYIIIPSHCLESSRTCLYQSVNDDKEASFNDDKEASFNDDKEASVNDDKEASFNDDKEASVNYDKEASVNDVKCARSITHYARETKSATRDSQSDSVDN
jgi:hypothetical protein